MKGKKNPHALDHSSFIQGGRASRMLNGSVLLVGGVTGQWRSHEWPWPTLPSPVAEKMYIQLFFYVLTSLRHLMRRCGLGLIRIQALLGSWCNNSKTSPLLISSLTQSCKGQSWLHLSTSPSSLPILGIPLKVSHKATKDRPYFLHKSTLKVQEQLYSLRTHSLFQV